jgi:hypothetical protein
MGKMSGVDKRRETMNKKAGHSEGGSRSLISCIVIMLAVLLTGHEVNAQVTSQPFSADMVKTKGNKTTSAKVNMIETAIRTEGTERGKKYITIMRYDRKVLWSIMPEQKMYVEMPMPAGAELATAMKDMMKDVQVKHEPLSSEQVANYHCDKSRMTVTWRGITTSTVEWAAQELGGFVVKKLDEKTGEMTEYQNIKLGPQDPSLFELPVGYQKLNMGGLAALQKPEN